MSRARRDRALAQARPLLDLAPMVDVVFTIVIFFMVSTTFSALESGLPIDLPQTQTNETQAADQPTVTITGDERIYFGGAEVTEGSLVGALRPVLEARTDKTVKLVEYRSIPSLQRYVMLEQDQPLVTVIGRIETGWSIELLDRSGVLVMPEIGVEVPVAEVYEGMEFEPLPDVEERP